MGAELNSPPAGENYQYKSDIHFAQHADLSQEEKVCYIHMICNELIFFFFFFVVFILKSMYVYIYT